MKLLRGSERDLKLDIASAQAVTGNMKNIDDYIYPKTPGYQIECSKPFMSLISRTFPCKTKMKTCEKKRDCNEKSDEEAADDSPKELECSRMEFYQTLKVLIRMGGGERQGERNARRVVSRVDSISKIFIHFSFLSFDLIFLVYFCLLKMNQI